jgi:hypothetical protein
MPNYCDNNLRLKHSDQSKIDSLEKMLSSDNQELFNYLRPNPNGDWNYDWSINNWGSKWDASIIDWDRNDNEIWISFESAWSPPTKLYDFLTENGWEVDAIYYEPGMGYGGIYLNGNDDYYEFDMTNREDIESLPLDLIEYGDLLNKFDEYEIDRLEEEWVDAERTEWYPMNISPVRDGYYELNVKGYEDKLFVHFAKFVNGEWDWWNLDSVIEWRGLTKDYTI